uniref:Transposase Tc1-like domain-containing protein n=1 Tax=Labrus bergylta TaxID=56723 RepID=A0A3Q3FTT9_9LABR
QGIQFPLQFRETGDIKDRLRSGRPRKTKPQEDRLSPRDLQARFAQRRHRQISDQRVRNRLHIASLRTNKAASEPLMSALHRQARLRWRLQHRRWNPRMWGNVMFSEKARFCLRKLDGRLKV